MSILFDHKSFDKTSTNICKGIAIILMYIHHSFSSPDSWAGCQVILTVLTQDQLISLAGFGKVCVHIFVFLSAYGTYRSTPNMNLESYPKIVKRRYLSLAGGFLFIYILSQLFSPLTGISRTEIYGSDPLLRLLYSIFDGLALAGPLGTPRYIGTWWYINLAIILIFLLPLLNLLADRIGWTILPLCFFFLWIFDLNVTNDGFPRYLPAAVMGILLAKYKIYEQICSLLNQKKAFYIFGSLVLSFCILFISYLRPILNQPYIVNALLAALICLFCFVVLEKIPGLRSGLALIGKYSMNMFLTHTLIRSAASNLHTFSYAPKYPVLIILLLLADTLLISIAIEGLKKLLLLFWHKTKDKSSGSSSSYTRHRSI